MRGTSATTIAPLNNTTREQAIVLLKRAYEKYRAYAQDPIPPEPEIAGTALMNPPAPLLPEGDKFAQQDFSLRLGGLSYRTKLELYASTEAGKPAKKPTASAPNDGININITHLTDPAYLTYLERTGVEVASLTGLASDIPGGLPDSTSVAFRISPILNPWLLAPPPGPHYSQAPFAAFVDETVTKQHWFAFTLSTAASKVHIERPAEVVSGRCPRRRSTVSAAVTGSILPAWSSPARCCPPRASL
jgi:hypothetical protein